MPCSFAAQRNAVSMPCRAMPCRCRADLQDDDCQQHREEEHPGLKSVEIEVKGAAHDPRQHDAERNHQHADLRAAACAEKWTAGCRCRRMKQAKGHGHRQRKRMQERWSPSSTQQTHHDLFWWMAFSTPPPCPAPVSPVHPTPWTRWEVAFHLPTDPPQPHTQAPIYQILVIAIIGIGISGSGITHPRPLPERSRSGSCTQRPAPTRARRRCPRWAAGWL